VLHLIVERFDAAKIHKNALTLPIIVNHGREILAVYFLKRFLRIPLHFVRKTFTALFIRTTLYFHQLD
jgi:hypothetical protein